MHTWNGLDGTFLKIRCILSLKLHTEIGLCMVMCKSIEMVACAGYERHVDELLSSGQRSKIMAKRDNSPLHVRGR